MPAPNTLNPLSDHQYREINRVLNNLANGYRLVEMAEDAGEDMSEYRTHMDLVRHKLEEKKRVFFPERP